MWSTPDTVPSGFSFSRMISSGVILIPFSLIDIARASEQPWTTTGLGTRAALCKLHNGRTNFEMVNGEL